jgi:lipopolysaccharide/colanic/teichoic acid biosynthesis glycosyltransferase
MKRLTDIVLSLTVLILLAPVLLLAALAVVLDSGLPVFFKQTRVGLKGREFGMFKFRSMVKNAASTGPYFTDTNDVRVTRVGQFIRRTSIDELPQIINVLLGDMSLVGPRPDVPVQQSLYAPEDWSRRCSVRPGITGLAQVMIRSLGSHQDRLDLDLAYIRDQNFWLDVKVMWLTLGRLSGKGGN